LESSALEGISKGSTLDNNSNRSEKYLKKEKSSEINDDEGELDYEEDEEEEEGHDRNESEKVTNSSGKSSLLN